MKKILLLLLVGSMIIMSGCGWNRWEKKDGSPTTYKQRHDDWVSCETYGAEKVNFNSFMNSPRDLVPIWGNLYNNNQIKPFFQGCMDAKGYFKKW